MNKDMDAQFLCKDCARFNQCQYYDRRKEDSYICKYFHLTETDISQLKETVQQQIDVEEAYYKGKADGIKECTARLQKMNEELMKRGKT